MRALLAAILAILSAPAQSEADKVEAALRRFGDREYRVFEKGNPVGRCTLKTRFEGEGGARLAIFEDRIEKAGDTPQAVTYTEKAALKGLRLRWATRVDGGITEDDPRISIEDGNAEVASAQGNLVLNKVEGACGERALIRLICGAEQKVGSVVTADLLVLDPVDYQRKQQVKCVAAETLDIGGTKFATFKWVDKREGRSILSGEPVPYSFNNAYWVGPDGALLKFTLGSMEMVLGNK
ncbi:MAG TPA: hypothetical protein VFC90_08555 [Planctomycetota bacterium]|nr:hypothetical protein [Planctomycetota bacterium]